MVSPPKDSKIEKVCVVNNKKNQFLSVFYHIRNSLAHGRFNIETVDGKKIFIMEDVSTGDSKRVVTGRMVLYQDTLIRWISIIERGEKSYCDTANKAIKMADNVDFEKGKESLELHLSG